MPTKRWIDKKSATTFAVVYRPQTDPRIHDEDAPDRVLHEVSAPSKAVKNAKDLEKELGDEASRIRANEGEAALHGVFYDDTEYDYMQHMRDLGSSTEAHFIEAQPTKKKGKGKQRLEDALRDATLEDDTSSSVASALILEEDVLPSKNLVRRTYQDQQDVPDALAGFQPDMDPRLREVLEALEDEAFVDDDEELFGQLAEGAEEVSLEEFEVEGLDEEDGWESDDTAKPAEEYKKKPSEDTAMADDSSEGPDWMAEYNKFKKAGKKAKVVPDLESSIVTGSSMTNGKRKKRKGAMTSSTGYSMTSSSLYRTEAMTTLDDRFDRIEQMYADEGDDDEVSVTNSVASGAVREDFSSIMDDFLGSYSMGGKKRVKKGKPQSGLEQLDEIRSTLGPARLKGTKV